MSSAALRLAVLGTTFSVAGADEGWLAVVRRLWQPFVEPAPPSSTTEVLVDVAVQDADDPNSPAERLRLVTAEVNRLALERYAEFAAHSAVVAFGDRVVAMPAVSGAGKTTMAAACVAAGAQYLSDEALCVRYSDQLVDAYPKPLALSRWSADAVGLAGGVSAGDEVLATAADLGGAVAASGRALTDVILLRRAPASAAALAPMHRADAVPLLLEMSFNHYRRSEESFALVTSLATASQVWSLEYDDPAAAAALLSNRLG